MNLGGVFANGDSTDANLVVMSCQGCAFLLLPTPAPHPPCSPLHDSHNRLRANAMHLYTCSRPMQCTDASPASPATPPFHCPPPLCTSNSFPPNTRRRGPRSTPPPHASVPNTLPSNIFLNSSLPGVPTTTIGNLPGFSTVFPIRSTSSSFGGSFGARTTFPCNL